MMEEAGVIVEVEGGVATVLCRRGSMCEHCASADACRMGSDGETMLVEALNPLNATIGQQVKVSIATRTFMQSSFLLYIVPLIALLIGAVFGEWFGGRLDNGLDPNLLAALFGCAALVVTLLVIKVAGRKLPKETYMPRIVAIIEDEE